MVNAVFWAKMAREGSKTTIWPPRPSLYLKKIRERVLYYVKFNFRGGRKNKKITPRPLSGSFGQFKDKLD